MRNPTKQKTKSKDGRPDKPRPDFPLYAHKTKRWAKKIRGKTVFFGTWDDPQAALEKYLDQKDDLLAGRKPVDQDRVFTVEALVNKFLAFKKGRADSGEL